MVVVVQSVAFELCILCAKYGHLRISLWNHRSVQDFMFEYSSVCNTTSCVACIPQSFFPRLAQLLALAFYFFGLYFGLSLYFGLKCTIFLLHRAAKQQQLRIWKGYQPSSSTLSQGSSTFSGKVVEVVNGDALVIKKGDQQYQKIWFSSIRPPRSVCT